jgi:hypothetical protein
MHRDRLQRCAVCVLLMVRTAISSGAPERPACAIPPDGEAQAPAAALAAPKLGEPATVETLRAKALELTRRFDAVEYDPWLRAGQLDAGIEPAFRWVRDNVRFESYAGAFRGAKGSYIAGAANAADRSLLLAELLKAKGFNTRFATGRLAPEQAGELFERIFAPPPKGAAEVVAVESPQRREFMQRVTARARRDFGVVRAALGENLPKMASPTREQVIGEIASHVWVQAETDGGKWVDLDSAFANAEPGKTFCQATATSDTLPADLHQRMTIRVIAERLNGAKLESDVVLEVTKPVVDLVGQQAALLHLPANQVKGGVAGFGALLTGGARDADPRLMVPTLALSMDMVRGKPVLFDDGTAPPPASSGGGFADLGGGGGAAPAGGGPQLVAEFLEFELAFPGGGKETTRRALVDRAGAAWRAGTQRDAKALRPLRRDAQGPIDASTLHNIWFSGGPQDMAAYAKRVGRLVRAIEGIDTRPAGAGSTAPAPAPAANPSAARRGGGSGKLDMWGQLFLIGMQNLPVVMIGDHDFIPALNDDPAARFYLDAPRILMFSLSVDRGTGAASATSPGTVETQIDLRRDKVRGVARTADAAAAVARRKLWFGLLGGTLEHEVTASQTVVMTEGAAVPVASTSALIDRGNPASKDIVVVRPGETGAAALKQIPCGPDASLRLAGALARGETLLIPRDAFPGGGNDGGFWAVAPSGDTRAVWGDDLHATVSRSPLPNPMSRRTVVHIIYDDLSSRTVGGTEYPGTVEAVATGTITVGTFLQGVALFVFDCAIWWIALH